MKELNTVLVSVSNNGTVRYPINETETLREMPVDVLSLDTRCSNGLKRNHIHTIGDLLDSIENGSIKEIHSLGRKSVSKIMYELCTYQYNSLNTKGKKDKFLVRIIELNTTERGVVNA